MHRPTLLVPLLAAGLALTAAGCAPTAAPAPTASSSTTPSPSSDAAEFSLSTLADLCSTAIADEHASSPAYDDVVSEPRPEDAKAGQLPDGSWAVAIPITQTTGDASPVEASWICTMSGTADDVTFGIRAESMYVVDDTWMDQVEALSEGGE